MRLRIAAALALSAACTQPPRNAGQLRATDDLVALAAANDADGTAAIALRGQAIPWLSAPYNPGQRFQESDREGLNLQPAFIDANPGAFVTTEIWDEFPRVWAQPIYLLVTGFDPFTGPIRLAGAEPVFAVSAGSRFYSPFWQTWYVTVPPGTDPAGLRSAEQILASGLPLTPGALRLCSLGPRELEVAHPASEAPRHPFTGDPVQPRLAAQAWVDGAPTFFMDFGLDRFRVNDAFVVQEVAMFHFAFRAADGTLRQLDLPPVIGNGPFRAPRAADAPDGLPRFGALRHEYLALITPGAGHPLPGVFIPSSRAALRAKVIADLGAEFVPAPSAAANLLPEREQFTLRVALDGSCFALTDFPQSCTWLDTQQSIEGNLPVTSFQDLKRFQAGALVQFDGVAP